MARAPQHRQTETSWQMCRLPRFAFSPHWVSCPQSRDACPPSALCPITSRAWVLWPLEWLPAGGIVSATSRSPSTFLLAPGGTHPQLGTKSHGDWWVGGVCSVLPWLLHPTTSGCGSDLPSDPQRTQMPGVCLYESLRLRFQGASCTCGSPGCSGETQCPQGLFPKDSE